MQKVMSSECLLKHGFVFLFQLTLVIIVQEFEMF